MTIILPPELWYLVIDAIPIESDDGWKALCKCLLVSRLFFLCSRPKLFSFLHICLRKVEKMIRLRHLLEYNEGLSDTNAVIGGYPPLKDCVTSLQISVWDGVGDWHIVGDKIPTIYDMISILRIFSDSTKLQEVHIESTRSNVFLNGDAPHYHVIKKICQSSSLVKLKISSDPEFQEVFNIWKIRELDLRRTSVYEDSEGATSIPRAHDGTIPQLEVFSYMFGGHIPSRWLKEPSPFSNLRKLEVLVNRDDYVLPINKLLSISAATLTTLHFYTHCDSYGVGHSLPNFKELRVLRVILYTLSLTFEMQDQMERITDNWEELPSSLRRIVIKLYFPFPWAFTSSTSGFIFFRKTAWIGLGDMLTDNLLTKNDDLKIIIELSMEKPPVTNAHSKHVRVYRQFEEFPEIWRARFPSIEIVSCLDSRDPFDF